MSTTHTITSASVCADPRRWVSLVIMLMGIFLAPLDFFILNVALPAIGSEFRASPAEIQLVLSSYSISYAAFLITGGRLGDYFGRKRLFLGGLCGFIAASLLCAFAWNAPVLVAGRLLLGLAAAMMVPQGLASAHVLFPAEEKPRVFALYGATYGLASVAGQILGGVLVNANLFSLGWRMVFLINFPVGAAIAVAAWLHLKESRSINPVKFDVAGVVLLTLTLCAFIVPLVHGQQAGWAPWVVLMLLSAPILAAIFWRHEGRVGRSGTPLVDPAVLVSPALRLGLVAALLLYAVAAMFMMLSIYVHDALGESALYASIVFLPLGAGFFIAPLSLPFLVRRVGKQVLLIGLMMEVAGLLVLAAVIGAAPDGSSPDFTWLLLAMLCIGLGQGLALPSLLSAVIAYTTPASAGMLAGVVNSALQISASLWIAVIGCVFYAVAGQRGDAASITTAFIDGLLCVALCLLVAAGCVLAMHRKAPTQP